MSPIRKLLEHPDLTKCTIFRLEDGRFMVSTQCVGSDGWHVVHDETATAALKTAALDFLEERDGGVEI